LPLVDKLAANVRMSTRSGVVAATQVLARDVVDGRYSGVASVAGVGKAKDPVAGGEDDALGLTQLKGGSEWHEEAGLVYSSRLETLVCPE
jgi:hypothetical protein